MTSVGIIRGRRFRGPVTAAALFAASGLCVAGVANADPPKFDVEGYSTCTATAVPAPGQDFDGVVTSCCEQNAGVPTPTTYGMACVSSAANQAPDFRPTIVLPTRPQSSDDAGQMLGQFGDLGNMQLPGDPNVAANPVDEGGPHE
jgi:hypothetical protein